MKKEEEVDVEEQELEEEEPCQPGGQDEQDPEDKV